MKGTSLFANVGVAEARLNEIGMEVLVANEIDEQRAKFYKQLYPKTEMIVGDITDQNIKSKIITESIEKRIDFIIATPPCQGMSVAGKREELDERNQLISHAIDVILDVNPKFALIENVPRQLTTKIIIDDEVMLIPEYVEKLLSKRYIINSEIIKCKDYGIPQIRERSITLLTRKDLNISWEFPEKEKEITLYEAIGNLPPLDPLLREGLEYTLSKFPNYEVKRKAGLEISKWHTPPVHSWKHVEWMLHTPTGKSAIYNEVFKPVKNDGTLIKAHHNNYRRLKWDMPCRTITQNNGVISSLATVHPGQYDANNSIYDNPRVLTIFEILIIMSLPHDWKIPEGYKEGFIRRVIGEGIPPLLIKKIFMNLKGVLNE